MLGCEPWRGGTGRWPWKLWLWWNPESVKAFPAHIGVAWWPVNLGKKKALVMVLGG